MKLLLDQNLSAAAAEILRATGVDVFHTREVGLARADDPDILVWCREQERILITLDADCHALLALSGATAPSIVRIRIEGLRDEALADLIRRVIEATADDLRRGSAVTVSVTSIRVHRLPLVAS
jgi:predicted nuclease of predicted toxin-antitoxin system